MMIVFPQLMFSHVKISVYLLSVDFFFSNKIKSQFDWIISHFPSAIIKGHHTVKSVFSTNKTI